MPSPLSNSSSTKPLFNDNSSSTNTGSKCFSIIVAFAFLLCLLCAILFLVISSKTSHRLQEQEQQQQQRQREPPTPVPSTVAKIPEAQIISACKATRNPETCKSSLIKPNLVPPNPTSLQIIQSALLVSSQNLQTTLTMFKQVLESSPDNKNLSTVVKICLEVLAYSQYRISQTNDSLPGGEIKNARAWMSAALSYLYDCSGGLKHYVNDTESISETMSNLNSTLNLTSNALSMMVSFDLYGNETESWKPTQTERDGFWEDSALNNKDNKPFDQRFPSDLDADAVVCKDGANGCYKSVQEAVDAAPSNDSSARFVIHIKEGVYEEIVRVPYEKKNVVFLGDGQGKTVITGSLSVGQSGVNTWDSATVGVLGDGFMASGLTIQNTAGAPTSQAVAFRCDSDQSVMENCEFLGNQDTLYAHSLRQYYKSCRIQGNVDFIFGNSPAVFEDCLILISPRLEDPEKGEKNVITAHGRVDPAQSTGFVFRNCSINGTEDYMALYNSKRAVHQNYLGRPWKEYSRNVFIGCNMEALIVPEGWTVWNGDFALKTLYYGEFGNTGPGSDLSHRVSWSSKLPAEHVNAYSIQNFIQGDEWIPASASS